MVSAAQRKSKTDGWCRLLLGEVLTLQRGFDLPHRMRRTGQYRIVTSSGREGYHNVAMASGPGVVTGRYGTIGQVFYVEEDFWPLNTTLYVRDFKGNSARFCAYLLETIDFKSHSGKSGVPGVNRNDLHEIPVYVPTALNEQEAIAQALSDADALIGSLETLITKKRAIKQGVTQDLLSGRKRLPGFSEKWIESTLGDVCLEIVDGTHFTPKYVHTGFPFYSVENVTADDFTNTKFISADEHKILTRRCNPQKGDILLTRIGAIGDTKLIDWDVDASIYVSLALLKSGTRVNPRYLHAYTKSRKFRKDIEDRSLLNASPRKINMGDISKVPVPVPSQQEQEAIADILESMDHELVLLAEKLAKARQLKQGMMRELLTGRVRLV
ncbi:type I restriction-modification system HsdS subunit protein (plasmid) [Rhizobium etli 8C-3]|uniref:Type I restriction-modification system HsdS subunit protein n=1 Tax=Rhizobium etli 8C-3 TaxID=538025 RepID=A0A1L5PA64_RHIET|nr:restriction endonuclease subunit S [Rhizobium etli]APO76973.1 type I restriction-modification system HsdS subunit protein [Rhizobium etli 8C-3]